MLEILLQEWLCSRARLLAKSPPHSAAAHAESESCRSGEHTDHGMMGSSRDEPSSTEENIQNA